jgi:competence protein ComEC
MTLKLSGLARLLAASAVVLITLPFASAQVRSTTGSQGKLRIFFIDVEGGQATLFVPDGGQTLLIDTGWPGHDSRDAKRIAAAVKMAGRSRIDYVLITHYHDDHVGGVPQLVEQVPVGTFIDHGPNRELDHGQTEKGAAEYSKTLAATGAAHIVAKVGDLLPVRGMHVLAVSADGNVLGHAAPGGGQVNPYCATSEIRPADQTENARSLGVLLTFGRLRVLDLGDLTWDKERTLMCPRNELGPIDIDIVSHHGFYQSSSPALVDAIAARVAVMDNGETKGGSLPTFKTLAAAPGLERLWQLHFSVEAAGANAPATYIANPMNIDGNQLELTAAGDGSFEVRNGRTGFVERYPAR